MSWWKCLVSFKFHSLSTRSINQKLYQANLVIVIGIFLTFHYQIIGWKVCYVSLTSILFFHLFFEVCEGFLLLNLKLC
jgi:integral membrane sensor domain MASE1